MLTKGFSSRLHAAFQWMSTHYSSFTCAGPGRCSVPTSHKRHLSVMNLDKKDTEFKPRRAVVLQKISRYEYEKQYCQIENEEELKSLLAAKGSDYNGLLKRHVEYYASLDRIQESLEKRGIETKIVKRFDYTSDLIKWADVIFSAGGDGTFLLAASKVKDKSKPVIGINTDTIRSEGYLCLPKNMSIDLDVALDKLLNGKFKWTWRQRIRITMSGKYREHKPFYLLDQALHYPEHRFTEHVQENEMYKNVSQGLEEKPPSVLPILALNEVFIGESLSARVSFYEMAVNDSQRVKQKSSGVTICTGTGASSWFFSINHATEQSVTEILSIANKLGKFDMNVNNMMIRNITQEFNNSLRFDPSELKMAYAVRDPVVNGIFQVSTPRGFAQRIAIRSRMWDACIVVDGGASFNFNDGAVAELTMHEEDALRTVRFD